MSSNRLKYDNCAYETVIKNSTSQLDYNIFTPKYENDINCPVRDYTCNLDFNSRADVESELYGLNRPGTLCQSLKYNPNNHFKNTHFSPAKMCENIYYITPNNLVKPNSTMLKIID